MCTGDFNLSTQAEVDAFCGCEEINGILRIGVRSTPTDITSLENLKSIKHISSALEIYNTSLTDLNGLENLTFIGGAIIIEAVSYTHLTLPTICSV